VCVASGRLGTMRGWSVVGQTVKCPAPESMKKRTLNCMIDRLIENINRNNLNQTAVGHMICGTFTRVHNQAV